jgi:hypothetical protein
MKLDSHRYLIDSIIQIIHFLQKIEGSGFNRRLDSVFWILSSGWNQKAGCNTLDSEYASYIMGLFKRQVFYCFFIVVSFIL